MLQLSEIKKTKTKIKIKLQFNEHSSYVFILSNLIIAIFYLQLKNIKLNKLNEKSMLEKFNYV